MSIFENMAKSQTPKCRKHNILHAILPPEHSTSNLRQLEFRGKECLSLKIWQNLKIQNGEIAIIFSMQYCCPAWHLRAEAEFRRTQCLSLKIWQNLKIQNGEIGVISSMQYCCPAWHLKAEAEFRRTQCLSLKIWQNLKIQNGEIGVIYPPCNIVA